MAKQIEPKRTGANASRKKEEIREKILTHVPRFKPGRLVLILAVVGFVLYYGVKFVKSGKIRSMIAPVIVSEGIVVKGISSLDSLTVVNAAKDSAMTISPKKQSAALNRVRQVPGVLSAHLGLPFSKVTTITIKERTPEAFVVFNGNLFFMSSDGYIWPFKAGGYWDFPVISGVSCSVFKNGIHKVNDEYLQRYFSIKESFSKAKNLHPVGYDLSNPDRISVRFNGIEPTIRFGNSPEKRLENMNGILEIVRRDDVEVRHYIDLSYKNVAFIR